MVKEDTCKVPQKSKQTNGDLIRCGLLTDRQMFEIWLQLGKSPEEWFKWLREEADEIVHDRDS